MRILVVEDEIKTLEFLRKGLTESGFTVDIASDGESGLHLASTESFDLIILDVMLPRMDGWSIVQELRRLNFQTPILILSARDSVDDRVKGLDLGADSYLIKPFAFSELLAHVRTLLRRRQTPPAESIKIADMEIDFIHHRACRRGKRLELTPKEFALLSLLARRQDEVLSRAFIADQVWGINFDSDTNVVDVHMGRLRSKVDGPFNTKLLQTVRGLGYVLRAQHT